jgi:mono/diheme cytochrome c family protein
MIRVRTAVLTLAVLGCAWPALGQVISPQPSTPPKVGNPAQGRVIAQRWCAECHVVAPGQTTAKADAPSFASIAERGTSGVSLEKFLMHPQPKMPDMQIGRTEAADLVAYIMTLKP